MCQILRNTIHSESRTTVHVPTFLPPSSVIPNVRSPVQHSVLLLVSQDSRYAPVGEQMTRYHHFSYTQDLNIEQ
jgi:hypothetical protein